MINFPLIKSRKAWMWISYLSKPWPGFLVTFLFSGKGYPIFYFQGMVPKLFNFQERAS